MGLFVSVKFDLIYRIRGLEIIRQWDNRHESALFKDILQEKLSNLLQMSLLGVQRSFSGR